MFVASAPEPAKLTPILIEAAKDAAIASEVIVPVSLAEMVISPDWAISSLPFT